MSLPRTADDAALGGPNHEEFVRFDREKPDHIMQFFAYEHLPEHLAKVSAPFGELAKAIVATLPRNREREKALDALLVAKDCAVRALVAK